MNSKNLPKLPDSELEIMAIVWEGGKKVSSEYIADNVKSKCQRSVLLTYLKRLCEKGFLKCEKKGKLNFYTPLVKKEKYLPKESKSFLEKMHYKSLTGFVAALYDGKQISRDELLELKKFIEETESSMHTA